MPRVKTYSGASGFVYQYQFKEHDANAEGELYRFETTQDRHSSFDVTILLPAGALEEWEMQQRRTLTPTERYALAKMALFQAFDQAERPDLLFRPVVLDGAGVGEIARILDL